MEGNASSIIHVPERSLSMMHGSGVYSVGAFEIQES